MRESEHCNAQFGSYEGVVDRPCWGHVERAPIIIDQEKSSRVFMR